MERLCYLYIGEDKYEFFVDLEGLVPAEQVSTDAKIGSNHSVHAYYNQMNLLLSELRKECSEVHVSDPRTVPWFPQKISDLDSFATKTLDAGWLIGFPSIHIVY